MLLRPDPTPAEFGHVVGMLPVYNGFPWLEDCEEDPDAFEGVVGAVFFNSYIFMRHGRHYSKQ